MHTRKNFLLRETSSSSLITEIKVKFKCLGNFTIPRFYIKYPHHARHFYTRSFDSLSGSVSGWEMFWCCCVHTSICVYISFLFHFFILFLYSSFFRVFFRYTPML
jgi:hypothetical protein